MSVSYVRPLYASMPDRIAHARQSFGRPLTLTEKILAAHCWDFDTQVWERGKAILRLRVDRVALQDVTVAIEGLPLCQAMVRPLTNEPDESAGVAVACISVPTSRMVDGSDSWTVAAGAPSTPIVADAVLVSEVAVITTVPLAMPLTTPSWLTVALELSELPHVISASTSRPFWSRGMASRVTVEPL